MNKLNFYYMNNDLLSPSLIAINGKKQSGKDSIAKMILYLTSNLHEIYDLDKYLENYPKISYNYEWQIKKFADGLKDVICLLTGCTREELESEDFKNQYLPSEWDMCFYDDYHDSIKRMTYRQVLQYVGTDLFRDKFHVNTWINSLFSKYKPYNYFDIDYIYPKWIISDLRFPNEAKRVKEYDGILIKVTRKETDKYAGKHISETSLDDYEDFDYIINNDSTIYELLNQVKKILILENLYME